MRCQTVGLLHCTIDSMSAHTHRHMNVHAVDSTLLHVPMVHMTNTPVIHAIGWKGVKLHSSWNAARDGTARRTSHAVQAAVRHLNT